MKTITISIDGSYSTANPDVVGWGFVASDGVRKHGSLKGGIVSMNQVGGELSATCEAILYARKQGYDAVIIRYDYEGVAAWAEGRWKAKNEWTQKYKAWVAKQRKLIDITFEKISGDDNPADAEARKDTGAASSHGKSPSAEALERFPKGTVALPQNVHKDSVPARFIKKYEGHPREIVWMYNRKMKPRYLGVMISERLIAKPDVYQWIAERRKAKYVCQINSNVLYMF